MANSYGTQTALSGNANSAASGTYTSLGVINFGATPPHECFVNVALQASAAPSGNKQAVIFLRTSQDGTTYSDAPSSTTEANALQVGALSLPDTSAHQSVEMPLSGLFGGALPQYVEIFVKNDCGVAFAASAQGGQYRTETFG
jgi:hypothetical protein